MKADLLLDHYEQIADAPDAIIRLRHFILDLAMRGKLLDTSTKFIPTTLGEVGRWGSGGTPTKSNPAYYGGSIPWLVIGDLNDGVVTKAETYITQAGLNNSSAKIVEAGTVLIAMYGSIGKMGVAGFRCATNQAIAHCVPDETKISTEYLFLTLKSLSAAFLAKGHGGAQQNISQTIIKSHPVSLPSLHEQHRIVAKVDELMGLCDRLEAARSAREGTRDQLAAASLARLNAPDPETFQADARFALDALPTLTTRPDQIKALRQTILNLAVRGKLVPQDPNDEPASELLKRIAKEKARLVKAGEISRDKPLPPLAQADAAFELPSGWEWARLGHLSKMVTSGSRDWAKHYANEGAIFVRMGNLSKDHYRLRLDHIQHVKPPADGEGTRTRLTAGDILISITGEVGMLGLIPEGFGEAYINQHTAMVRPIFEIKGRYLPELFRSPFAQAQFNEPQRGIKNSFRLTDITRFVVPLPPIAEQHRIVAKVDELMGLCDLLERSLTTTAATRRRLLDALLAEALAPVPLEEAA
jgi:type I restriction enzyme S subunit